MEPNSELLDLTSQISQLLEYNEKQRITSVARLNLCFIWILFHENVRFLLTSRDRDDPPLLKSIIDFGLNFKGNGVRHYKFDESVFLGPNGNVRDVCRRGKTSLQFSSYLLKSCCTWALTILILFVLICYCSSSAPILMLQLCCRVNKKTKSFNSESLLLPR